jgi:uncharacterized peroxidase-related enzyme
MFLKDLTAARGGRYGKMIQNALTQGLPVSGIWYLLAFKPEMSAALSDLTQAVMRCPSPLTYGQRELIAAFTSTTNHCSFCSGSHIAAAGELLDDAPLVKAVCTNLETAPISDQEKALLRFVGKVTLNPSHITQRDLDDLKGWGWSDEALYDAITVTSLFNFYNRWNDAHGTQAMTPEGFAATGKRLAEKGYA